MQVHRSRPILLALLIGLPVILFSLYISQIEPTETLSAFSSLGPRDRNKMVGGVVRPEADLMLSRFSKGSGSLGTSQREPRRAEKIVFSNDTAIDPYLTPLERGKNPQMDSVLDALETGEHRERLSPMTSADKFDLEAWKTDPQTYLAIAQPGRIYDTLQPSETVAPLKAITNGYTTAIAGEAVRLSVRTQPDAPATFTNFSAGVFSSGLNTITVQANKVGLAQAEFLTYGGGDKSEIVVGSPLASGTVRFIVDAIPKQP